jgi:hypothetical protein
VYTHRWRPGDLVIGGNRCMLHKAEPYDVVAEARVMHSVRSVPGFAMSGLGLDQPIDACPRQVRSTAYSGRNAAEWQV